MNRPTRLLTASLLTSLVSGTGAALAAPSEGGRTTLISVDTSGAPANRASIHSSISADGRFVAFVSFSPYLVANDTNMVEDVFVRDRLLETTVRVSVESTGLEANARSLGPEISGDGRYVTFISFATNLVANDVNGRDDVFRHDLVTGETILVSVSSAGVQQNAALIDEQVAISHDGDRIVFTSEATNLVAQPVTSGVSQVYVREVSTGTTRLVSMRPPGLVGNGISHRAEISADGNHVTFKSYASNLVVQDTNGSADIFLAELPAQTVERVSLGDQGQQVGGDSLESSVSGDGRLVAFMTWANNVVPNDTNFVTDVFLRDRATGTTQLVSRNFVGAPANDASDAPVVSDDGTHVLFRTRASDIVTGDGNGSLADLILVRLAGTQMEMVTVSTAGRTTNSHTGAGDVSSNADFVSFHNPDGRRLAYGVFGTEEHVFVRDRTVEWPLTYCPVGVNSLGCVTALTVTGTSSISAGSGFVLSSSNILNQQTVVLFYSLTGSNEYMWYAGTICLAQPWLLGPVTFSGGMGPAGTNCTGAFDIDVNTFLASGQAPGIGIGTTICAQAIHRDPGFHPSRGAVLTDAVVFRVGP
jgi:Tol biopolymer transport system component